MELTAELSRAVRLSPDEPLPLTDPETKESYVLMRRELFDRIRSTAPNDEASVEAGYRLAMDAFREGWEDRAMDVYDALDPRKNP